MITIQMVWDEVRDAKRRIAAVEGRQVRFMRMWIATSMTSPTSTPTGPIGPTSTAATAASPTTATASTPASKASWLGHAKEYLPKLVGYVAERYLLPMLFSAALTGWALVKRYGEAIWGWQAGWWVWLASLAG